VSTAPYPLHARIVLNAPLEVIAARVSPAMGRLEALDAGRCEFHTGANSLDSLAAWISLLGVDFEVREPPELVGHLLRLAERLHRATALAGVQG
jgi:predicted DNA-binding transcriptional regulator YafY